MMAKSSKTASPVDLDPVPASFEAAMSELDGIVTRMEDGALPLADALAAYQRGAALLVWCQKTLSEARQQVRILEGDVLKEFSVAQDDATD